MIIKSYKKLLIIISIYLFLSGCGFTIHNINSLPPQLRQIYYQTEHPYETFEINFRKKLIAAGVDLLPEPKKSAPIINIASNYSYNTSTSISSTQARVYNLTYSATITITDFHNKKLLDPQVVSVSRSVTLQSNEVFEATPQISIIKQEMQQELTIKILNILSAPNTFRSLFKHHTAV